MSSSYKKEFLIEVQPTVSTNSISKMDKEVQQIIDTVEKNKKITFEADTKLNDRREMESLAKEIKEITKAKKVSRNMNLMDFDLDKKQFKQAEVALKKYSDLAESSGNHRAEANFLEYEKIEIELKKMVNSVARLKKLGPPISAKEIKEAEKEMEKYNTAAQSVARRGWGENGFTSGTRADLIAQNNQRRGVSMIDTEGLDTSSETLQKMTILSDEVIDNFKKINTETNKMDGSSTEKTTKEMDKLGDKSKEAADNVKKTAKNTKDVGNSSTDIKKTTKATENLAESFKRVARWSSIAYAWREMGQQVRSAIGYIRELDVALTEIAVVTGKSREQVYALGKEFNNMARRLGRTTAEVTQASKIFFRQGKTTEQVMKLVEATTIAASVAHIDLADASDYLTSTLNGFQMQATEAMDVVDKFSAVGANAGTSFEEMAQALKKVASSANNANVDIDHMISYLATVSEVTREAPENIGTSFKTLFARMQKITDGDMPEELNKVDTALKSIGVSLTAPSGQIDSLQTIIEQLGGQWKDLTKNQQAYLATTIAGTRQQVRFISLMDNYNRSLEILETSLDSAGEAQQQFGAYLDGIEASTKELKSGIENLYSMLVKSDDVSKFIDLLIDLTFRVESLVDEMGAFKLILATVATFMIGKMVLSFIAAEIQAKLFAKSLNAIGVGAKGAAKDLFVTSSAVEVLTGAFKMLKMAIPYLLAIGTAFMVIHEALDRVHYSVGEAQEDLKEFRDLENEINKLAEGKAQIKKYEDLNEELKNGNLTLEERKGLLEEIDKLELSIAGRVKGAGTQFNDQGERIATDIDQMKAAWQTEMDNQIIDVAKNLKENDVAYQTMAKEVEGYDQKVKDYNDAILNGKTTSYTDHKGSVTTKVVGKPDEIEHNKNLEIIKTAKEEAAKSLVDWIDSNDMTIKEVLSISEDKLTEAQKSFVDIYKLRGDRKTINEYEFFTKILPKIDTKEGSKSFIEKYWTEFFDGVEDVSDGAIDHHTDLLKDITQESLNKVMKDLNDFHPSSEESGTSGAVRYLLKGLKINLDDFDNPEQKMMVVTQAIEDFNSAVMEMEKSNTTVLKLKDNLNQIKINKDTISDLQVMLDKIKETGNLDLDDIINLDKKYDDFNVNSMNSVDSFEKFVKDKMGIADELIEDHVLMIALSETSIKEGTKKLLDDVINDESDSLGIRIDNRLDYAAKVLAIEKGIRDSIEEMYRNYGSLGLNSKQRESAINNSTQNAIDTFSDKVKESYGKTDLAEFLKSFLKDTSTAAEETYLDLLNAQKALAGAKYSNLEIDDKILDNGIDMISNLNERISLEEKITAELENMKKTASKVELVNLQTQIEASLGATKQLKKTISELYDKEIQNELSNRRDLEQRAKDDLTEIYDTQHEERMSRENEEYETYKKNNDQRLKDLRDLYAAEDYENDLKDMRKDQEKIQDKINEYKLIGTAASNKKILELQKEYDDKQAEIDKSKTDKTREQSIKKIEEEGTAASDAHEDRLDEMDEEHDEKIDNLKEEFDMTKLNIKKLKEITKDFGTESQTAIGKVILDLQGLGKEYDSITEKVNDLRFANLKNSPKDNKNGLFSMTQEDMQDYISNKFSWSSDLSADRKNTLRSRNDSIREDYKIDEDNMTYTDMVAIFKSLYGEKFVPTPYADGGVSTSTHIAQLHGTEREPEFIFNYEQMGALKGMFQGESGINIGTLVTVEGSIDESNLSAVVTAVDTGIEKLKRAISDRGRNTRISGAFI